MKLQKSFAFKFALAEAARTSYKTMFDVLTLQRLCPYGALLLCIL